MGLFSEPLVPCTISPQEGPWEWRLKQDWGMGAARGNWRGGRAARKMRFGEIRE